MCFKGRFFFNDRTASSFNVIRPDVIARRLSPLSYFPYYGENVVKSVLLNVITASKVSCVGFNTSEKAKVND